MSKIKYDSDLIKLITLFESMSGANAKDCITYDNKDNIIFIIEENEMGKAIGKNGANIKRVEDLLKRKIKLVEFSQDILQFVKNMICRYFWMLAGLQRTLTSSNFAKKVTRINLF